MKKYDMTYHASHDRQTRILDILEVLGVGEDVATMFDQVTGNLLHLQNNGVIVVTDKTGKILITMWVASTDRARHFVPEKHLPRYVEQRIKKAQDKWNKYRKAHNRTEG